MIKKPVTANWWWIFPRVVVLVGVFMILHYIYEWIPSTFTMIIGAVGESNFQHWKIATFSFIVMDIIEIPLSIGEIKYSWWWFGKIFSTVFITFVVFIFYYTPLMFLDTAPSMIWEIIIAVTALVISDLADSILEWMFREKEFHWAVKVVLLILFVLIIAEFIVFTFKMPIYDVFADPYAV